jgi:hypothetical protein
MLCDLIAKCRCGETNKKNLIRSFFQVEMKPKKKAPRKFFRKAKIYCTLRVNSSTSPPLLKFAVAQCIHKWLFFAILAIFSMSGHGLAIYKILLKCLKILKII